MSRLNQISFTFTRTHALLGMLLTFIGGYLVAVIANGQKQDEAERVLIQRAQSASRDPLFAGASPALGKPEALVTVVEFADFQCPYCVKAVSLRRRLQSEFGEDIRWVFKQFPLDFHPEAAKAAEASLAAASQGRFWEYHDWLFANQRHLSANDLDNYAKQIGLNASAFNNQLKVGLYAPMVSADKNLGLTLKVNGTPTFFINGRVFDGGTNYGQFAQMIRQELSYARYLLNQGIKRPSVLEEMIKRAPGNNNQVPTISVASGNIDTPPVIAAPATSQPTKPTRVGGIVVRLRGEPGAENEKQESPTK